MARSPRRSVLTGRAVCAGSVEIAVVDVGEDAEEIRRFLSERGVVLDSLRGHRFYAEVVASVLRRHGLVE